jgi:hypothetical protein
MPSSLWAQISDAVQWLQSKSIRYDQVRGARILVSKRIDSGEKQSKVNRKH